MLMHAKAKDARLIQEIADRAVRELNLPAPPGGDQDLAKVQIAMDLTACHLNGNPLKLRELLKGENFSFAHDIYGIRLNLNRKTGKLQNFFTPRYSQPEGE
jgi:hypothetical protein